MTPDRTRPDSSTTDADERGAEASPDPGREPTLEEAAAAEQAASRRGEDAELEEVGEHHREMDRRGARQRGEGRVP